MKKCILLLLALCLLALSGCIVISRDQIYATSPIGDELLSLNRAKDVGILSQDEYLQLRKAAVDRALAKDAK